MRCKPLEKSNAKHKKGLWSPDEDQKLQYYVMNHGHISWTSVPINAGLQRNGKSCRLRWLNYLRPGLKRGAFSMQEEETILTLHGLLGNKWSQISQTLPGRTDNEIKNYWHSHLKKRVATLKQLQTHPKLDSTSSKMASTEPSSSLDIDSSSAGMDWWVPPRSQVSNLPKILFADWVTLNEFQQDFGKSSDLHSHQVSTAMHGWQCEEGSTKSSETQNCLDGGSNDENMFHTEMTIDQTFNFNDGDFDIDDIMYM